MPEELIPEAHRDLLTAAIVLSGLSSRQYATEVLMRDERTVRRWLAGEMRIPGVVLRFLERTIDEQPPIEAGK